MAGSLYKDDDEAPITDINVTPFVDVVLVLLVVFMITAKLIVARGVEIDKPKAATGGDVQSTLRVSVNATGELFLSHTKLDGVFTLRLAVGNIRTEESHVRRAWGLLNEKLSELQGRA